MARTSRRSFGAIEKMPSGRYRARYTDPYGRHAADGSQMRHNAPFSFAAKADAEAWLVDERRLVTGGDWTPPSERLAARRQASPTMAAYAPTWLAQRKVKGQPLADRTRDHYQDLLDRFILPRFADVELKHISPESVALWYDTLDKPTYQAHAYSLLRAIMRTAADPTKNNGSPLIPYNPCGISGGGSSGGKRKIKPATVEEIVTIVQNMPDKHRLMVILADSCALRFGELAELRRMDVDTKNAVIHVRRSVVRSKSAGVVAKAPKSEAGIRDVPIPPDILEAVIEHRREHAAPGPQGLMFPGSGGGHLSPSAFYGKVSKKRRGKPDTTGWGWYEARRLAGREDLRFHDLRHGALTEAARHGATLAELMALGGHSTSQAAMRYQQAASDRLAELARKRAEARGWTASTD
ncbi:tyrosine-type recombinase/integrase [Nocardioides jishulii]|uniref:Site-specific integrase n=1 Tax=Nocardioides jishulii TaxID=2575440 RepID=A0A4U2YNR8_9ACTN|nr:site-specific integrase [Nocardioides jishulii]QCX27697.1 site-specific integrase [Nocardioides jishulii]TKI62504.1 site-specific integrase [Nocardioides jishulii]